VEIAKAGKFIVFFAVAFFGFMLAALILPLQYYELATAQIALWVFGFIGLTGSVLMQEPPVIMLNTVPPLNIAITFLCTGLIEAAAIFAAIAASLGIEWRKRVIGIICAMVFVFLFNQLRILLSVMAIIGGGMQFAELAHDVLFRVTLFITIAVIYAVWFFWATKSNRRFKKAN
jgi:exosortase/archaeosortase family protein